MYFSGRGQTWSSPRSKPYLKVGGKLLLVDWSDSFNNLGPAPKMVVTKDSARSLCEAEGFVLKNEVLWVSTIMDCSCSGLDKNYYYAMESSATKSENLITLRKAKFFIFQIFRYEDSTAHVRNFSQDSRIMLKIISITL